MEIDLSGEALFESDSLIIDKKATFILGKNGTGKSTLANIISEQAQNYDVSVFNGFDNIIDDNKRLNAVVLGEENAIINKEIEALYEQINHKQKEKEIILISLTNPKDDNTNNYWTRRDTANKARDEAERHIVNFYTQAASDIRRTMSIVETYNKNNFKDDIAKAGHLDSHEKEQLEALLRSEVKFATSVELPQYDLNNILDEVNALLTKKVAEKTRITRLSNDNKREFAQKGLEIHQKGDVCAFCGAVIKEEVFTELETYFSADEVKLFQNEIDDYIEKINSILEELGTLVVNVDDFYPQFQSRARELVENISARVEEHVGFFNTIIERMTNKKSALFNVSEEVRIRIPDNFLKLQERYEALVSANNTNDLEEKKKNAHEKLKLNLVQEKLDEFEYNRKVGELNSLKDAYEQRCQEFDAEVAKITGANGIDSVIKDYQEKILDLQKKTKNEAILTQRIKDKLHNMVSFELESCRDSDSHGIYKVKDIYTGEVRDITQLSTGEKNIIAFLYFLEKLHELKDEVSDKPKLIVFDDPMNSNDDNMQYLIIEELLTLLKTLDDDDKFILLTHNKHFYLNVIYGKGNNVKRIHLHRIGQCTTLKEIKNCNDDIKTSYEALWFELKFIYESNATADMMLNPIRRIIETFAKFNCIDSKEFYSTVVGAKKLFDVNSHSIDDLEADLNGKEKEEILMMFNDCFEKSGYSEHFKSHWEKYGEGLM